MKIVVNLFSQIFLILSILQVIVLLLRPTPVMASLTVFWKTSPSNISTKLSTTGFITTSPSTYGRYCLATIYSKLLCMKITQVVASLGEIFSKRSAHSCSTHCLKTRFLPLSVSEVTSLWVFMCLNSLFGFSDSSAIYVEHITQIAFPNMCATQNVYIHWSPRHLIWLFLWPTTRSCSGSSQDQTSPGTRGKFWRPHIGTWGLSEANVLYWRKYLWHCWDFSAPPQWFGDRGNMSPLLQYTSGPAWIKLSIVQNNKTNFL